jgi:predicted metalloendopeptidase
MLSCEALPFEKIYTLLKASKKEKDPQYYLQKNLWKDAKWKEEFMITLQAMMYTQKMGKLENGWHLLARLHLLERERKYVKSTWENKKYSLGFSTYALEEFKRINNNDWMLISLSFAAGLDFRSFLSMYGIPYSEKAAKQVESFLFPSVPQKFFLSTPTGYCEEDQYGAYLDKQVEEI